MTELHELSAAQAAAAVRRREISPVDLVRALLDRIDAVDGRIQAWETVDREGALAAAADAELRVQSGDAGPLLGVPFGVKDIFFTAGLKTTAGFPVFAKLVPAYDAAAVARLKAAGAIVLGKTVTTQFAFVDSPPTHNPWNAERTPGGSSSGSGAAVAARMVPAALGSQTAGSVLRPAAYCGAIGFKPSYGRISRYGVFPLSWSLDHIGLIVRTVEDAALFLQAMAGHDPRDPGSSRRGVPDYGAAVAGTTKAPRLGLLVEVLDRAESVARVHALEVARWLESAGAVVREVKLPVDFATMLAVQQVIMQSETASVHADQIAAYPDAYGPKLRAYAEVGQLIPAAVYVKAQRLRRRMREQTDALLKGFDALLLPTVSNVAPDPSTTGDPSFQAPWTALGLPAISLPTGLSPERLPLGTQLVGGRFREDRLLAAARWCEQALDPMPAPPPD